MTDQKKLWEILVPKYSNQGIEYDIQYHNGWDKKVRDISGGITILKSAKGQWKNPEGKLFEDKMIPVRIFCSEKIIDKIIGFTLDYYKQESVMAYEISSNVKLVHKSI